MNIGNLWTFLGSVSLKAWAVIAAYMAIALIGAWLMRSFGKSISSWIRNRRSKKKDSKDETTPGTPLFYAGWVAGMSVSINTSWLFFGNILGIKNIWELCTMFFVLELYQLACGWGMRASMRKHGRPGPAEFINWSLCAASAWMALDVTNGNLVGLVRVVLGPFFSMVMLHLALGVEIRGLKIRDKSTWIIISNEFKQRFLATLGLSDEGRSAKSIIRQRALVKAGRIRMKGTRAWLKRFHQRRFIRQLAKADIVNDPIALEQFVQSMKLSANADRVWNHQYEMPPGFETATETCGETSETKVETVNETGLNETSETETRNETSGETETRSETVLGIETETSGETETETETPAVSIKKASDKIQSEVETLFQLMMERDSANAVSLVEAMEMIGRSKPTSHRRLVSARERFNRQAS